MGGLRVRWYFVIFSIRGVAALEVNGEETISKVVSNGQLNDHWTSYESEFSENLITNFGRVLEMKRGCRWCLIFVLFSVKGRRHCSTNVSNIPLTAHHEARQEEFSAFHGCLSQTVTQPLIIFWFRANPGPGWGCQFPSKFSTTIKLRQSIEAGKRFRRSWIACR